MEYNLMKENVQHGNSMFPLKVYEVESDIESAQRISCHWHDEVEIFLVTEGEAVFHINERNYHVSKGDVVFIHPDFLHSVSGINDYQFDFIAVVFSTSLLDSFLNDAVQQNYLSPVYVNKIVFNEFLSSKDELTKQISALISKIQKLYDKENLAYELGIKACLLEIWYMMFSHAADADTIIKNDNDYRLNRLKSVMTYIQNNYNNKITIDELASITGLCTGQFCRSFKSMTRMSAVDYINHYRIMQSVTMITTTSRSISEIAGLCGFNNISYFNKIFMKYMHTTPSDYRKIN